MKKSKKKKEKHIVGTKELVFDIVSIVIIVIMGIYFGYRSIFYYSKETTKKKEEKNTLAAAIINNNKITKEDNGFRKDKEGYYFSGKVENNYLKAFGRMYRIIDVSNDNVVKVISDNNEGTMIFGNDNVYSTSNVNMWLNKTTEPNSGIYYNSIPAVEKLLNQISYCDGELQKDKIKCTTEKQKAYFTILDVEDYVRALGKNSYLNNGTYSYILGYNKDKENLVITDEGNIVGVSNYEGYGIRAVMEFKKNITVSSGTGTKEDPYVINQEGNDNNIYRYVRLGTDNYQIIEEKDNYLKLKSLDYMKVNNNYLEKAFNKTNTQFSLLSKTNIGYYLNKNYYNILTYGQYLIDCTFNIGEISLNQDTMYKYTNIYKDSVQAKIGLLNMFDLNYNNEESDYYLINTTSTVGSMAYVVNNKGYIEEVQGIEEKKIVPVICIDKSTIKAGDGNINSPYVVE